MKYGKIAVFISGAAQTQHIFPCLQRHHLFEGDLTDIACLLRFQRRMFIHGIGSCDLGAFQIFQGKCKDRIADIYLELPFHLNGKFLAFFDHIGDHTCIIPDGKIHDLAKLTAVFQDLGIQVQAVLHSFTASGMCFQ